MLIVEQVGDMNTWKAMPFTSLVAHSAEERQLPGGKEQEPSGNTPPLTRTVTHSLPM
jgi:hypothetical protein